MHGDGSTDEEWRPVVGHEDWYEVSNMGRVRSWRVGSSVGAVRRRRPYVLESRRGNFHPSVTLCADGGNAYARVHRLVLEAFVGPCPEGMEGSHINGVAHDNRVSNLVWETHRENEARKDRPGNAKLSADDVAEIRAEIGAAAKSADLARRFGVTPSAIRRAACGTTHPTAPAPVPPINLRDRVDAVVRGMGAGSEVTVTSMMREARCSSRQGARNHLNRLTESGALTRRVESRKSGNGHAPTVVWTKAGEPQ